MRAHELLFVANWFDGWHRHSNMHTSCVPVGWSLAVDLQAHAMIAVVVALLPSWRAARNALGLAAVAGAAYRAVSWAAAGAPVWVSLNALDFAPDAEYARGMARRMGMALGPANVEALL